MTAQFLLGEVLTPVQQAQLDHYLLQFQANHDQVSLQEQQMSPHLSAQLLLAAFALSLAFHCEYSDDNNIICIATAPKFG